MARQKNNLSQREDEPRRLGLNQTQPPTAALQPGSGAWKFACVRGWSLAGGSLVIRSKVGNHKMGKIAQDAAPGRHK